MVCNKSPKILRIFTPKSENIIKNIELMSAALDQMEKDILKKKNFKNKKND